MNSDVAPQTLSIDDSAVAKIKSLLADEADDQLRFRVFVTGGGCAGFQYGFTFDDSMAEDDTMIVQDQLEILVDSLSIQYLSGSQIVYTQGLEGARFSVKNPQAVSTCGCGSSFTV